MCVLCSVTDKFIPRIKMGIAQVTQETDYGDVRLLRVNKETSKASSS